MALSYEVKDIGDILQINGEVTKLDVTRLTAPGENYLSVVLKVDLELKSNGDTKKKSIVAKCVPAGDPKSTIMNSLAMKNEINWYLDVVPLFKNFLADHGIDDDLFPKYYGSRLAKDSKSDNSNEKCVLLLDNLIIDGYGNVNRYEGCDLRTCKAILKSIALFHAIPLAMKNGKPKSVIFLKNYINSCAFPQDIFQEDANPIDNISTITPETALYNAMVDIPECASYLPKLKEYLSRPVNPAEWHKPGTEPWSTVCHNDFWINNVMIKNGEHDVLIKFLDFQMCAYKSFATDLVFFLLTSVKNDILLEHIDELLRYYYVEFSTNLDTFQAGLCLSYDEYLEELRTAAVESELTHALIFSTIIFGEKDNIVDIEDFEPLIHLTKMIQNMSSKQRQKLITITILAATKNWL